MSRLFNLSLALLVSASAFVVQAQDKEIDPSIGTIHKVDMTEEKPKAPNFILLPMDVKKLKVPGAHGHVIVRQFTKRSRIEFDGSGLPKGKYTLGVAASCKSGGLSASAYRAGVTELHRFSVASTYIATEKSLPKVSLREAGNDLMVLEGKALMLFHSVKNKFEVVDCKIISG